MAYDKFPKDTCLCKYHTLFDKLLSVEINQQQKEKHMKKLIATSMAVFLVAPAFAGGQAYQQQTTDFFGWNILPYVALRGLHLVCLHTKLHVLKSKVLSLQRVTKQKVLVMLQM